MPPDAPAAGGELPGIDALDIQPRPLGLFLDRWMVRYRRAGRFADRTRGIATANTGGPAVKVKR